MVQIITGLLGGHRSVAWCSQQRVCHLSDTRPPRSEGPASSSSYAMRYACTMLSGLPKEVPLKLVLTLAALALLAALLPTGAAETARRGVFPYPIHTRTLDNGL